MGYSADELRALADVIRLHRQVMVLSDDLYEHLVYDGFEFNTLAALPLHVVLCKVSSCGAYA